MTDLCLSLSTLGSYPQGSTRAPTTLPNTASHRRSRMSSTICSLDQQVIGYPASAITTTTAATIAATIAITNTHKYSQILTHTHRLFLYAYTHTFAHTLYSSTILFHYTHYTHYTLPLYALYALHALYALYASSQDGTWTTTTARANSSTSSTSSTR
jgi:hypothetical protein